MPKNTSGSPIQLRFAQALRDAGISVERKQEYGMAWFIHGFGQAALSRSLETAVRSLMNKLTRYKDLVGHKVVAGVLRQYEEGYFHE